MFKPFVFFLAASRRFCECVLIPGQVENSPASTHSTVEKSFSCKFFSVGENERSRALFLIFFFFLCFPPQLFLLRQAGERRSVPRKGGEHEAQRKRLKGVLEVKRCSLSTLVKSKVFVCLFKMKHMMSYGHGCILASFWQFIFAAQLSVSLRPFFSCERSWYVFEVVVSAICCEGAWIVCIFAVDCGIQIIRT